MASEGWDNCIGEKREISEKLKWKSNSMGLINPVKGKTPQWACKDIAVGMFTFSYVLTMIDNFKSFILFFLLPMEWNLKVKPLKKKKNNSYSSTAKTDQH